MISPWSKKAAPDASARLIEETWQRPHPAGSSRNLGVPLYGTIGLDKLEMRPSVAGARRDNGAAERPSGGNGGEAVRGEVTTEGIEHHAAGRKPGAEQLRAPHKGSGRSGLGSKIGPGEVNSGPNNSAGRATKPLKRGKALQGGSSDLRTAGSRVNAATRLPSEGIDDLRRSE